MRGKKSYNIRNIEAHINTLALPNINEVPIENKYLGSPIFLLNQKMNVKQNNSNLINYNDQNFNEYLNSKYGVSKYASNLVSGKMFKKI